MPPQHRGEWKKAIEKVRKPIKKIVDKVLKKIPGAYLGGRRGGERTMGEDRLHLWECKEEPRYGLEFNKRTPADQRMTPFVDALRWSGPFLSGFELKEMARGDNLFELEWQSILNLVTGGGKVEHLVLNEFALALQSGDETLAMEAPFALLGNTWYYLHLIAILEKHRLNFPQLPNDICFGSALDMMKGELKYLEEDRHNFNPEEYW